MKKGLWSPEEDLRLIKYIQIHGEGNWRTLPLKAGLLRCGKACRLRWMNYLRPDVKRGHISPDEEDIILRLHKLLGNRWSLIAGRIPGRSDNEIKNYWNTHLSKRFHATKIQPAHKQPSSNDKNGSAASRNEEVASMLLGTEDVYNARPYVSKDGVEPIQDFKQIIDISGSLTAINDFSNVFNNVDGAPWSSSMVMPCNFPPPFISSAGYENITDMFFTENINNVENLAGSESNMQLHSAMLTAECNVQIPSCRDEMNDAFIVDYDNMAEVSKIGKNMVVNSNTITPQCWEPFSALSDWLDAPNDCTFYVEDCFF